MNHITKSLRFKVTLLVITVELLIFTGVGVFYTHRFSQEVDNAIIARLSIPGLLMSCGELSFDAVSDKRTMEGLLREPYREGIVIGLDGHVYFSSDPARLETHPDAINGLKLPGPGSAAISVDAPELITPVQDSTGRYLTSLSPLRPNGKLTGYLYLKVGTEISEAEKSKITILFAIGSLGTIALTAAILSWLLHLTVIRRLNYLVEIFRRFALGDYAARAESLGGDDEIATLMNGFNGLAKRLEDTLAHLSEDITERKRAEEALRLSSERLQLATRVANIGIWDWDIPRNELVWDDSMYQLYGIRREDFGGAYDAWIRTIHPDEMAHTDGEIQAALRGERKYAPEFRIVRTDGTIRYIKADSRTTRDPEGKPLRMIGTNIDITDLKQAEMNIRTLNQELEQRVEQRTAELSEAKERAEVASQAKSDFLANMSHELRTPLNAILGYAQIIKLQNELTDRQQQRLEIIRTSGEHLLTLINDILDVGKIEAEKMELEELTFHLPSLLAQAFNIMRINAEEKDLSFHYEADDMLPENVRGDERKLRQILLNLLSNAVKYTRHGKVTLQVSYDPAAGMLCCEVADSGIGIAPDKLEMIFEPFTQLVSQREVREGTGLGLTITRQLVALMRGRMRVESEPGKGSVFRVEVPLATVSEGALLEKVRKNVTGYRGERKKVLVVDDNTTNASMMVSMLESLGFAVAMAGNGREAVDMSIKQRPDLVLLDLVMPGMDGLEVVREMRLQRLLAESRIIGVSASVTESGLRDEFMAACDDFMAKPIHIDTLLDKIGLQLRIVWETALSETPVAEAKSQENEELDLPSSEELLELYDLAMRGDMRKIHSWATELEARDSRFSRFAGKLREMAGGFKAKAILALLEESKGKSG